MEDEKRIENPGLKDCNCKLQSALQTFSAYHEEQGFNLLIDAIKRHGKN